MAILTIALRFMEEFHIYFQWGLEHIISMAAWDHILFIAALAVIFDLNAWRQVLVLVTAFTIGHFLTLWLAVLDVIRFSEVWVEFLIPLTIVLTALANLTRLSSRVSIVLHYALALGFGLVHGMGYANAIRFSIADQQNLGWSLFAFNLGLEIGQLFVVLMVLLTGVLVNRFSKVGRRRWEVAVSLIILILSLIMVVDRIPKI